MTSSEKAWASSAEKTPGLFAVKAARVAVEVRQIVSEIAARNTVWMYALNAESSLATK